MAETCLSFQCVVTGLHFQLKSKAQTVPPGPRVQTTRGSLPKHIIRECNVILEGSRINQYTKTPTEGKLYKTENDSHINCKDTSYILFCSWNAIYQPYTDIFIQQSERYWQNIRTQLLLSVPLNKKPATFLYIRVLVIMYSTVWYHCLEHNNYWRWQ